MMTPNKKSRQPSLEPVAVSEARQDFSDLVNRVHYAGRRFVLTRNGKTVAALVPIAEVEEAA